MIPWQCWYDDLLPEDFIWDQKQNTEDMIDNFLDYNELMNDKNWEEGRLTSFPPTKYGAI